MREDMYDVLVCNSTYWKKRYRVHRRKIKSSIQKAIAFSDDNHFEEIPSFQGMSSWLDYKKGPHYKFRAIERYLLKKVGCDWISVQKEISSVFKATNSVKIFILDSIENEVEQKTFEENGKVYYYSNYSSWKIHNSSVKPIEDSFCTVYVDPQTGKLKRVPKKKRYRQKDRKQQKDVYYVFNEKTLAVKRFGEWYGYFLEEIPDYEWKEWTEKEKEEVAKAIENNAYHPNSWMYKKSDKGRWIRPEYKDLARYILDDENCDANRYYNSNKYYLVHCKQLNKKEKRFLK